MNQQLLKLKTNGKHLAGALKNHPTWFLILLISLLALYALIIFGLYAIKDPDQAELSNQLQIKSELYQQTLQRLQARDSNIQRGVEKTYPDIFR